MGSVTDKQASIDKGEIRPLRHTELTATLIIEPLSWWAMDVRYASFETREIPRELAEEVCLDNLIPAYRV